MRNMPQFPKPPPHMTQPPQKKWSAPKSVYRGIEARRGELLRSESAGVQLTSVAGKILVAGSGQANVQVDFPVTFVEQPSLSFGAAVDDNYGHGANNAPTSYPEINVMIAEWTRVERLTGVFHYRGALISAVLNGSPGYVWVHWQATGKAFRNPATAMGDTNGAI